MEKYAILAKVKGSDKYLLVRQYHSYTCEGVLKIDIDLAEKSRDAMLFNLGPDAAAVAQHLEETNDGYDFALCSIEDNKGVSKNESGQK